MIYTRVVAQAAQLHQCGTMVWELYIISARGYLQRIPFAHTDVNPISHRLDWVHLLIAMLLAHCLYCLARDGGQILLRCGKILTR